jgi:DNA-binding transcriptional LysR family regulator
VDLTEAGRLFRIEVERTLVQADHARRTAQRAARGEVGHVKISFSGNAAFAGKLAEDIRTFRQARPRVSIELAEMAPADQLQAILDGRMDVGYCPELGVSLPPIVLGEDIGEWPWVVGMALNHPFALFPALEGSQLREETFVTYAAHGDDDSQEEMLTRLIGKKPQIAHRVTSTLTVLTMAAAGLGLSLIPEPLCNIGISGLAYVPVTEFEERSRLLLLGREGETRSAPAAFRQHAHASRMALGIARPGKAGA